MHGSTANRKETLMSGLLIATGLALVFLAFAWLAVFAVVWHLVPWWRRRRFDANVGAVERAHRRGTHYYFDDRED